MFIGGADDIHLQPGAPRIAYRTDPAAVYGVAQNIVGSSLRRVSRYLADIPMNFERAGMHDHSRKILSVTMDPYRSAHIEVTEILPRTAVDVHDGIESVPGAHPHSDATLTFRSVDDEPPPSHPMGVIEETA